MLAAMPELSVFFFFRLVYVNIVGEVHYVYCRWDMICEGCTICAVDVDR